MTHKIALRSMPTSDARPGARAIRPLHGLSRVRHRDHDVLRRAAQILTLSVGCLATGAWAQGVMPDRMKASPTTQAFLRADVDHDGKLSKDEAARLPAIAEKFAALDRDGDGYLNPEEFAVGYEAKG